MFASKEHFFSLEAYKLILSFTSGSPDRSILKFFGSPTIESVAFCMLYMFRYMFNCFCFLYYFCFSVLLIMKKRAPS